jgi:hypothetical protein
MPRAIKQIAPFDLIVAGDLHAGRTTPECRTDDVLDALCAKLGWLDGLQRRHDIPLVLPGDVFDNWRADSVLLNRLMEVWPVGTVLAVPGQHDLPQHNIALLEKTGFRSMALAGRLIDVSATPFEFNGIRVYGADWETEPPPVKKGSVSVLVWHVTTWEKPFAPGQKPGEATRLLKANRGWDLIITGDNHQTFECEDDGRCLLNAGSVLRLTAVQVDYRPCVYLWRRDGSYEKVYIPVESGVVTRDALEKEKEKERRKNAFVEKLAGDGEVSLSFDENVAALLKDEPDTEVKRIVLECTGR